MSKPDFVDNQKGNLLVSALKRHLQWRLSNENSVNLDIATGYVNPDAFSLMADELEQLGQFRLLIGADPLPPSRQPKRKLGENDEKYELRLVNESIEALSKGLQHDRDLMGFHLETSERLERMLTLLKTDKVEVKRFPGRFMHGKAYIFSGKESYLVGSSNFTAAGLTSNLELNVGRYDPQPVEEVADWFEDLWSRSEDFKDELIAIYEQRLEMHRPYLVFLRILWELYGKELEEDSDDGGIALTSFQSDGLRRAERIIEKYNGVIIADGVGLGKTFLAGGLIEKTLVKERKRVLLIGPAALVRGPWRRFMDNQMQGLQFEAVSFQQLSYLDDDNNFIHLRARPEEYDLIVIDEAQAYRNPATTWAESLRRLLRGHPPKKVVMLSATPVNNSLWDLYNMLMYFIGNDAAFAELGIRSLRDRFKVAQDSDPFTLNPDYLFEILDATTVRRTRRFIKKYYGGSSITIKDDKGKELQVPITFPKPHVRRVDYSFTTPIQTLLDRFIEIVVGDEDTDPELTMARYTWGRYALEEPDEDDNVGQQMAMTGLLRTSLLKRLESSVYALAETCNRMRSSFEGFLAALELGSIPKADVLGQWIDADGLDNDEFSKILDGNEDTIPADGFDVDELKRDVQHDLKLIIELHDLAREVNPDDDPKLHQLLDELRTVIKESEVEGGSPEQKRNRRKVLLFSYYEDTLRWVKEFLEAELGQDAVLKIFDGRLVSVAGSSVGHGVSRDAAVFGFAPISSEAPAAIVKTDSMLC
ncbi:MAG: phospholipase D-like domain-containing protein [Candidatus Thalassarchaeaceae archaeon]